MTSPWSYTVLPSPRLDPLFSVAQEAKTAGPKAINGAVSILADEQGGPLVFRSTALALTELGQALAQKVFDYPSPLGLREYRQAVAKLLFGKSIPPHASIAATGGTGALAIALRLLKLLEPASTVILPVPAWVNYSPLLRAANLNICEVEYVRDGQPSVEEIAAAARRFKGPFGVLLQVGCHNPTGLDFSPEQWRELATVLHGKPCMAILDITYQGLCVGPEEDMTPLQLFLKKGIPTLVTWSASKNHTIDGLRTGLACAVVPDRRNAERVEGHFSAITRGLHSAAPTFGQMVVALVQAKYRREWLADLENLRATLLKKRKMMLKLLPREWKKALSGIGMFAMLPLSVAQIDQLKAKHSVFLTADGRISIAGIPMERIEELCTKLCRVL